MPTHLYVFFTHQRLGIGRKKPKTNRTTNGNKTAVKSMAY